MTSPRSGTAESRSPRPSSTRSNRLPRAPPRISATPAVSSRLPPRCSIHSEEHRWRRPRCAAKNQRCQPPAPARKLNAAPGVVREDEAEEAGDRQFSPSRKTATIHALGDQIEHDDGERDSRANATTARCGARHARAPRRHRRGWPRSARTASGCARVGAHVGAPMPAAFALRCALGVTRIGERVARDDRRARRRDDDEAQIVAERSRAPRSRRRRP